LLRARTANDRAKLGPDETDGGASSASAPTPQSAEHDVTMGANGGVEKCINCQFYDRKHAKPLDGKAPLWGQCRRHSPRLNPITAKTYIVEGVWPLVRDDDWCGEWKILSRMVEEWIPELSPVGPEEVQPPVSSRGSPAVLAVPPMSVAAAATTASAAVGDD
jgi:hypothetical protein